MLGNDVSIKHNLTKPIIFRASQFKHETLFKKYKSFLSNFNKFLISSRSLFIQKHASTFYFILFFLSQTCANCPKSYIYIYI